MVPGKEEIVHVIQSWEAGTTLSQLSIRVLPFRDVWEAYRVTVNGRTIDDPPILHTGDMVIFWPVPIDLNDPFGTADVIGGLYPALCRPPKLARGVALALIGGVLTAGAIVLLLLRLALYPS